VVAPHNMKISTRASINERSRDPRRETVNVARLEKNKILISARTRRKGKNGRVLCG
jgi:hypothetical protein